MRRDNPQSKSPKQNITAFAQSSFGGYTQSQLGQTLTKSGGSLSGGSETLVLYENHAQDSRYSQKDSSPTITSRCGTGGNNLPLIVRQNNMGGISVSNDVPTLTANAGAGRIPMAVSIRENIINRQDHNGGNGVGAIEENCYTLNASGVHAVATRSDVRRLTPLECERLQGFPDNWTLTPTACDTNRYKALGNAITVNVAEWIFKRLKECAN